MQNNESEQLRYELKEFYDDFRNSCMAKKYYGNRLSLYKRISLTAEIILAVGASTSFATLKLLADQPLAGDILPFVSGAAALLAIAKPLIGWDKDIERYSKLTSGYIEITEQMKRIVARIRREQAVSTETRQRIGNLQSVIDRLVTLDDPSPRRQHLIKLQEEVVQEFPATTFWWPVNDLARSEHSDECQ